MTQCVVFHGIFIKCISMNIYEYKKYALEEYVCYVHIHTYPGGFPRGHGWCGHLTTFKSRRKNSGGASQVMMSIPIR